MPFSEENVLDFVKWLEKSYFVERALGRIEKLLAPEFYDGGNRTAGGLL